jgi:hypothetical protein
MIILDPTHQPLPLMTKQELIKEFWNAEPFDKPEHVDQWLSSALDRYAMQVVEASVPPVVTDNNHTRNVRVAVRERYEYADIFNSCCAQTLENAKKLCQASDRTA